MTTLSSTATDAEINAAVAEHVSGWVTPSSDEPYLEDDDPGSGLNTDYYWKDRYGAIAQLKDYLHSADAVIELLEKDHCDADICFVQTTDQWHVRLKQRFTGDKEYYAFDESFCRAACIALLPAHGVTVSDSP